MSRPSRARGLKPIDVFKMHLDSKSRPSRARGLKQTERGLRWIINVAPFTGAWIETRKRSAGITA